MVDVVDTSLPEKEWGGEEATDCVSPRSKMRSEMQMFEARASSSWELKDNDYRVVWKRRVGCSKRSDAPLIDARVDT